MKRILLAIAALVILGLGVSIIFGLWSAHHSETEAQEFLQEFEQGRVGQPAATHLSELPEKWAPAVATNAKYYGAINAPCTAQDCTAAFMFDNFALARLRFSPPTYVRASFRIRNGILASRGIIFESGRHAAYYVGVSETLDSIEDGKGLAIQRQWSGGRWKEYVTIAPPATAAERAQAYSINLSCLHKLTGCRDALEMLPSIPWSITSGGR